MTGRRWTVAIVDNQQVDRHGLMSAVATADDLRLLYANGSIRELDRELALGSRPDVVLLDLALGADPQGIAAVAHVHTCDLGVLVVSNHFRDATVCDAFAAGARGFPHRSRRSCGPRDS